MKHHVLSPISSEPGEDRRQRQPMPAAASSDQRWSEVVPPNSALMFAVLWDPEDEIVAFSSPDMLDGLDNIEASLDSPTDACDSYSQVLTIGHSTIPLSENTATMAFFRENHDFLFTTHTPLTFDRYKVGRTQTSSTLEGFDVYLRGSMFSKTHLRDRQYSFLGQLAEDFKFDPRTSFANMWHRNVIFNNKGGRMSIGDEGFAEGNTAGEIKLDAQGDEHNLSSAFSVTTTSTSNYVAVEMDEVEEDSTSWSTMEAPNTPGFSQLMSTQQHRKSSARLKKRRPAGLESPAPPSEVLQRPCYNHVNVTESHPICTTTIPRFVRNLSLKKWRSSKEPLVLPQLLQP